MAFFHIILNGSDSADLDGTQYAKILLYRTQTSIFTLKIINKQNMVDIQSKPNIIFLTWSFRSRL